MSSDVSAAIASPVLSVKGLNVHYGGIHAVHDINLEVRRGELTTLIGANGAGKTTTLKAIAGLLRPSGGAVHFDGINITGTPAHSNVTRGLVLCPEGRRIFPDLTVDENLDLGAYIRHDRSSINADVQRMHEMFPILKDRASQLAGTLSGGEQQMLAIARALISRPKLLMLDEPSLGLAPMIVSRIFSILKELKEQQVTILLVEQNARKALEIADRAYVLETGRLVREGDPRELASDPHVMEAYLGGCNA
ncbi:MAG TPA: ABC transporter ATP-binding protein [Planctomycetota bacterium]|nr:ABC transporter ATP-binding protein [Planctomycetota bacterium]